MSQKWRRSQAWDDAFFPPWAFPAKFVLRAFSSIWLAVILLSFVAMYGALASVPVGMIVAGLTYLLYAISLLAVIACLVVPAVLAARRVVRAGPGRFIATFLAVLLPAFLGVWGWLALAWPRLRYDSATGEGLMLFAGVVRQYSSTTVRRLPGMEMSELEFYSWWPLPLVLLLFVLNMIVATVRRIEFSFPNIGVLTVHSGIVLIALGSVYYSGQKLEGDILLQAGPPTAIGKLTRGAPERSFYDNTRVVLYARQEGNWEQRPLRHLPRYNDYGLDVVPSGAASAHTGHEDPGVPPRSLSLAVPPSPLELVDADLSFRVVGYASYAEPVDDWLRAEPAGAPANPLRQVAFLTSLERPDGVVDPDDPAFVFTLLPGLPAHRVADRPQSPLAIEYTIGMSDERFGDLAEPVPEGALHAIVVEVPRAEGAPFRAVYSGAPGGEIAVGETGYRVQVIEVSPEPPFPIITPGYRGATSSLAQVRVTPPQGEPFTRYVYHRFPEINQDMLPPGPDGRPVRRDPDPGIRIAHIDASKLQVYFDETPAGVTRAIVRTPDGVRVEHSLEGDRLRDAMPGIDFRIDERWEHAVAFERPSPVPAAERDRQFEGNHGKAMIAVEVSAPRSPTDPAPGAWTTVVWVPFSQYLHLDDALERRVDLPGGRSVTLAFGRRQHQLPGFAIALVDFEMISYDHRGAPRDYQSTISVVPAGLDFPPYTHVAKLNAPLRAPFHWSEERSLVANAFGRIASSLSPRQFKFSQAGWDRGTWTQTQELVDQGQLGQPFVRFTILQVGNNPGIHIIALGGICMGVGIPWAFYLKPVIMKRRKMKIQRAVARGEFTRPGGRPGGAEASPVGAAAEVPEEVRP
ncbi:MAG TPA: hypothetical protein VFF69_05760 [Phycisphaerales bacterium]|nr:hypothetical protein [Phycisphaerales bacterium]